MQSRDTKRTRIDVDNKEYNPSNKNMHMLGSMTKGAIDMTTDAVIGPGTIAHIIMIHRTMILRNGEEQDIIVEEGEVEVAEDLEEDAGEEGAEGM